MCGRYALHASPEVVALQFGLASVPTFAPRYNIAPDAQVLVVKADGAALARWRLKGKTHNARAETFADKPLFRGALRCLLPANGFYEWKRAGARSQPYYVRPAHDELFALAAIWHMDTCAVLTTAANATMARIHDRMPVLIDRERYAAWLAGAPGLASPAPDDALVAHPVGMAVNTAANDSPELVRPAPVVMGDLFGD
jgi:putative SOS response-associated peptidase YedK